MGTLRTFIAFDTPPAFKEALAKVQRELRQTGADARWETTDKFHGTLKFLGDTEETLLATISERIRLVVAEFGAMSLRFDKIGFFPNNRKPRVVWIGCTAQPPVIVELKTGLDRALESLGYEVEPREFHAHITLGRIKNDRGSEYLISRAEKINFEPFPVSITEIQLMKSTLKPSGSVYSLLQTFSLR